MFPLLGLISELNPLHLQGVLGSKLLSCIEFQGGDDAAFLQFICSRSDLFCSSKITEPPCGCSMRSALAAWAGICLRVAAHSPFASRNILLLENTLLLVEVNRPRHGEQGWSPRRRHQARQRYVLRRALQQAGVTDSRRPSSALRDLLSLDSRLSGCSLRSVYPARSGRSTRSWLHVFNTGDAGGHRR